MRRTLTCLGVLLTAILSSAAARAAEPANLKNELGVSLGAQAGTVGWAPGGAKLFVTYQRSFTERLALDVGVNLVLGNRWGDRGCYYSDYLDRWVCDHLAWHGASVEGVGGVAWRFKTGTPALLPFVRAQGLVAFLSYPTVGGFAIAARGGGGLQVFLHPRVAFVAEANLALGFSLLGHAGGHLYLALDLGLGVGILF